jgi:hypothetical protein
VSTRRDVSAYGDDVAFGLSRTPLAEVEAEAAHVIRRPAKGVFIYFAEIAGRPAFDAL